MSLLAQLSDLANVAMVHNTTKSGFKSQRGQKYPVVIPSAHFPAIPKIAFARRIDQINLQLAVLLDFDCICGRRKKSFSLWMSWLLVLPCLAATVLSGLGYDVNDSNIFDLFRLNTPVQNTQKQ